MISTLGKGLGGGSGGYCAGKFEIIKFLNQRSRSYIFSSTLGPGVVNGARWCIKYIKEHPEMFDDHQKKILWFWYGMKAAGFEVMGDDETAVCPIFIWDEAYVVRLVNRLFEKGLYTVAIAYPVCAVGTARIRMIVQAGHTFEQIDKCI